MLVAVFNRSPPVCGAAPGLSSVGCALAGCGALDTAEVDGPPADFWSTSKVSSGPTRLPTLMFWPSSRSMAGTRRPSDEHPVEAVVVHGHPAAFVEPQHQMRPRDQWIRDAQISVRMSQPMTTLLPATNVCAEPLYRTVSSALLSAHLHLRKSPLPDDVSPYTPHWNSCPVGMGRQFELVSVITLPRSAHSIVMASTKSFIDDCVQDNERRPRTPAAGAIRGRVHGRCLGRVWQFS